MSIRGPGDVGNLGRTKASGRCPRHEQVHRGEDPVPRYLDQLLEICDPTLAPHVDGLGCQPTDANEHVDGADVVLLRHGLLGRLVYPRAECELFAAPRHRLDIPLRLGRE